MTATTEFFWPAGIQRPPFRHGLITSNIVSNIVNYSAILLTLLQAILNQVLPPSFSVSTSVVFLTGKTARQPYLAALLRPRAYGPHWRHGRSHSHGNPRERFREVYHFRHVERRSDCPLVALWHSPIVFGRALLQIGLSGTDPAPARN